MVSRRRKASGRSVRPIRGEGRGPACARRESAPARQDASSRASSLSRSSCRVVDLHSIVTTLRSSNCLSVRVGYANSSYPKSISKSYYTSWLRWVSAVQISFQTYPTSLPSCVRHDLSCDVDVCWRWREPEPAPASATALRAAEQRTIRETAGLGGWTHSTAGTRIVRSGIDFSPTPYILRFTGDMTQHIDPLRSVQSGWGEDG